MTHTRYLTCYLINYKCLINACSYDRGIPHKRIILNFSLVEGSQWWNHQRQFTYMPLINEDMGVALGGKGFPTWRSSL